MIEIRSVQRYCRPYGKAWLVLQLSSLAAVLLGFPLGAIALDGDVPAPLVEAVDETLTEWAEFASTGDLNVVESGFALDGPQQGLLAEESARRFQTPSPQPLRFTARDL